MEHQMDVYKNLSVAKLDDDVKNQCGAVRSSTETMRPSAGELSVV